MMTGANRWIGEDAPCWVCAAVDGTTKAFAVFETPNVLVLVSPLPLNPGHTLVVPRRHVRDLYTLPEELAGSILSTASRVARAAKRALCADGITLRQHNDTAGGQEVFHFHLHVVPRFSGDAERFNAPPKLISFREQEDIAGCLRVALSDV
jgi:histidine triad (HIT) family protein